MAIVVCALVGAWLLQRERAWVADDPPRSAASIVARLALQPPEAAEADRATEPPQAADADTIELCGAGRVARKALDDPRAMQTALGGRVQDAVRRTVARLQTGPDDRSRAAAELLIWSLEQEAAARSTAERIEREGIDCSKEFERCWPASTAAQREAVDRLVRAAVSSTDPWVYRLAHQFCARPDVAEHAPACQLISVARWAQLEPDNTVPWLLAAAEAQQRDDTAAVSEALHRAAQARRSDVRFAQSVVHVRAGMPADVAPFIGLGIDVALIGVESAFVLPQLAVVSRYCAADRLGDPNRRAVCEDLARLLVERSTSLLDLNVGLRMAERLGWAPQRLAPHAELRDAVLARQGEIATAAADAAEPFGCATVTAQRALLGRVGLHGELAAYKALADASPLGRAGLAARHRAETARAAANRGAQNP